MVELVISTAILMSIAGFGTASYLGFNERQIVEQAGKNLKNDLRLAQQNAINAIKNDEEGLCAANQSLQGWCVSPDNNNVNSSQKYFIYGVCGDGSGIPVSFPSDAIKRTIPRGAQLVVRAKEGGVWKMANGIERARFNTFGQGVQLQNPSYSEIAYCVQGTLPTLQNVRYQVRVTQTGELIDDGIVQNCFQ